MSLAVLGGCSSDASSPSDGPVGDTNAPAPPTITPAQAIASRAAMRGPNPFAFKQNVTGAWIAQQQRDRAVFQDEVMKIEDPDTGEAMELSTGYVGRGRNLWFGPSDTQVDDYGVVRMTRNGIVERYQSYRWATEQAWDFAEQPSGTGDLVVRVDVGNVTLVETLPEGLHFKSTTSEFLYENATWVDANGTRTSVTPKWTGTAIEMTVPASVLSSSIYPATLDPLSGPFTTGTKPAYAPTVASSGTKHLIAWEDYSGLSNAGQIYFAIYDTSTSSFTKTATALAASAGVQQAEPAAGFDGSNFVVAFWDTSLSSSKHRIKALHVSTSGAAGSATTLTTNASLLTEGSPSVACRTGSTECGIAFHRTVNVPSGPSANVATQIVYQSFSSTNGSRGQSQLTTGTPNHYAASIATDGTNYFIVWEQGTVGTAAVGAATIATGTSTDSAGSVATIVPAGTGEAYGPAVAYAGSNAKYVVAFSRYNGTDDDAKAVIATSSTTAAPTASSEATIASGSGDQDNVAIACSGGTCVGAYYESSAIKTKSVSSSSGTGSGGATLNSVTTGYRDSPKLGYGSSGLFAAWNDQSAGYYQTYGRTVGTSGSAGGSAQFKISQ